MNANYAALQMSGAGLRRVTVFPGTISYVLLLLFILALYASPGILIRPLAAIGISQLVVGLVLAALVFEKVKNREGVWLVWPHSYLLAALIWTAGLSCFAAIWPRLSVTSTIDLAKYGLIYLVIVNTINNESRLRGVLWTMVLAGLFPALGALHNYVIGNIRPGERAHWIGIFENPNDLAYSLVLLVPLAIALLDGLGRRQRLYLCGMIAIYIAAIYITFSRGSVIGLMAVLLLIGIRHRARSVRIFTFTAVAASLIFIVFFWSREQGFTNLADFTLHQRLVQVRAGLDMFLDRPLLGVGLGGSVAAFRLYAPQTLDFTSSFVVHNTFVLALSELGLIGGLFYVLFVATGLVDARRLVRAANAEKLLSADLRGDVGKGKGSALRFRANSLSMKQPSTASLVEGLSASLWGYVVCGLFGPYLMSWFPFILIGLVSAMVKMRQQQNTAAVSTKDLL